MNPRLAKRDGEQRRGAKSTARRGNLDRAISKAVERMIDTVLKVSPLELCVLIQGALLSPRCEVVTVHVGFELPD